MVRLSSRTTWYEELIPFVSSTSIAKYKQQSLARINGIRTKQNPVVVQDKARLALRSVTRVMKTVLAACETVTSASDSQHQLLELRHPLAIN